MSRADQIAREKGDYPDHMTSRELCLYLHVDPRTLRKWRRVGRIPEPAQTTPQGWGLWSPAQQREILNQEARLS